MSQLHESDLFANRYLLIKRLGSGAFSEVWKAKDIKADLIVAIKIYAPDKGMDEDGIAVFSQEFSLVFNISHQNLLRPNHFDVWNGSPFLVLPFCQRGNAMKLIGGMSEKEAVQFMHDVAAGLEFLHDQNPPIIHQDIKPDNVLITEEGYYKLTDFGISMRIRSTLRRNVGKESSAGTMAYMAPERFERDPDPVKASDIWSLGATMYELMTGDVPFGNLGGISLKNGAEIPEVTGNYSKELKELVEKCLSKETWDRPRASQIKEQTELFLKTGKWTQEQSKGGISKKTVISIAAAAIILLIVSGLWVWDYNKVKVRYYKDYVEQWGVPQGIGKLSKNEASHSHRHYKFESKKRKLQRISHVNSLNIIISDGESERVERPLDMLLFYNDNGDVSYCKVLDNNGKVLFKKTYNDKLNTVIFQFDDEYGTEKTLSAQTIGYKNPFADNSEGKGKISRWLIEYDENGFVKKIQYAGFQNVLVGDAQGIFGRKYVRDEKGRVIEEHYLGRDGEAKATKWGLGIKKFYYDDDDNWIQSNYMSVDKQPSYDDVDGISIYKMEYDKYGNIILSLHCESDESLMLPKKQNYAGTTMTYDKHGFITKTVCLGVDKKPCYILKENYSGYITECDENGFFNKEIFVDVDEKPCVCASGYAMMSMKNDEKGNALEMWCHDIDGNLCENTSGYAGIKIEYDNLGNQIRRITYDKNEKPCITSDGTAGYKIEYDEFNNITKLTNLGVNLEPCKGNNGYVSYVSDYDKRGNQTKLSFYDEKGKLTLSNENIAGWNSTYDDNGNEICRTFFNTKENPCLVNKDYAKWTSKYDDNNNQIEIMYYGLNNQLIVINSGYAGIKYQYDERGNVLEKLMVDENGNLAKGKLLVRYKYDKYDNETEFAVFDKNKKQALNSMDYHKYTCVYNNRNQIIEKRYYGTDGNLTLNTNNIAVEKHEYNKKGERIKTSYFNKSQKPCCCEEGWAMSTKEYDEKGNVIRQLFYNENNKPTNPSVMVPEGVCKYDKWGNLIYIAAMDGYGKLIRNPKTGWAVARYEYDVKGNKLLEAYYDKNDKPTLLNDEDYSKIEYAYDDKNNIVKKSFYGTDGHLRKNSYAIQKFVFENGNRTEISYYDANNNLYNNANSLGQAKEVYSSFDTDGTARVCNLYSANGTLLKTFNYDDSQGWVDSEPAWRQTWKSIMPECPIELTDEIELISVKLPTAKSCSITIRYVEVSKYNLSNSDLQDHKTEIYEIAKSLKENAEMPDNTTLVIIVVDKAKRELFNVTY